MSMAGGRLTLTPLGSSGSKRRLCLLELRTIRPFSKPTLAVGAAMRTLCGLSARTAEGGVSASVLVQLTNLIEKDNRGVLDMSSFPSLVLFREPQPHTLASAAKPCNCTALPVMGSVALPDVKTSDQQSRRKDALELRGARGRLPGAPLLVETGRGVSCRRLLTRMASADLGCAASWALCAHLAALALASSAFSSSRLARASMQLRHDQGPCDKPSWSDFQNRR